MSILKPKKLGTITVIYWFFLLYILVALVFWFFELQQQNEKMTGILLNELRHDQPDYYDRSVQILDEERRKTAQYVGEGVTFLALILVGAVFVYRATRRQIKLAQQQQNFMMAVTHELKTPIAVTQLNLETLQRRKLEPAQEQKLIANTLQEANRLNSLCNNILLASQYDAGAYRISKSPVDFSDVVNKSVHDFATRFPQRIIEAKIQENAGIKGEQLLLEMLVNNLLDNALKYTPRNKKVTIALSVDSRRIRLTVADEGPGIADSEKKKVFDKFYRIGSESTRSTKGSGLGLYLCKRIATDHNGVIKVADHAGGGATFIVDFKR